MATAENTSAIALIQQKQQHFEQKQSEMKASLEGISRDQKATSEALRQLTTDISVLVTNVTHLTNAIEKIHSSTNSLRQVELDLVQLRTETKTISELWDRVNDLKTRVSSQNIVIRAAQVVAGAGVVALMGIAFAKLYGG